MSFVAHPKTGSLLIPTNNHQIASEAGTCKPEEPQPYIDAAGKVMSTLSDQVIKSISGKLCRSCDILTDHVT